MRANRDDAQRVDRMTVYHLPQLGECPVRRKIGVDDNANDRFGFFTTMEFEVTRILLSEA
jgi:hypothetical protein